MKKIVLLMLVLAALLAMAACGETPDSSTVGGDGTTVPTSTTAAVTTKPEGKLEETDAYTAVLNEAKWENTTNVDASAFDYFGAANEVTNKISADYVNNTRQWQVITESGEAVATKYVDVKKLGLIGAKVEEKENNVVLISVTEVEMQVQPSWKSVTAKAGSYLMFEFKSSLPVSFTVTVTKNAGDAPGKSVYTAKNITTKKSTGGVYTGIAKCTVPYAPGQSFYINIGINDGKDVLTSVPVNVTKAKYDSPYQLIFEGDWEEIRHDDYLDNLIDLFYNVYPRLYQRWGTGEEPKVITFKADKTYDGVAYCAGTLVCVSTAYANANPNDIGFFAHEITHSVQQFDKMYYGDGAWFTEAMADLGRFRYFHWGYSTDYVRYYTDSEALNFKWEPYSQHNMFMVWLDWKYPTTKNADGSLKLGLMDYIVANEKAWTGGTINDNPKTVGSTFNNWVKDITGVETMEQLRLNFIEEYKNKTFDFKGFRDYVDNFRTEDIPGVPNPTYPMEEEMKPTASTHDKLTTPITTGTNLCVGATIKSIAGEAMSSYLAESILDGDVTTRLQARRDDGLYKLNKIDNEIVIDLGAVKTFDTYTLYSASNKNFCTKAWEILVSTDGKTYTAIDYQKDNNDEVVSVSFDEQSARYITIRLYDAGSAGVTRLYEFMLFDKQ